MNGIITINDLVEQLVGALDDVERTRRNPRRKLNGRTGNGIFWQRADLEDVAQQSGARRCRRTNMRRSAAFVFGVLGTIPDDGTQLELDACGLHIKVLEVREHRMERAAVCLLATAKEEV